MTASVDMRGVWTAVAVDQWGQVWPAPGSTPEPYHRILVVRALLDHQRDVSDIQDGQVLYEAQGWKDTAVEWQEAQAVAAALNAAQGASAVRASTVDGAGSVPDGCADPP